MMSLQRYERISRWICHISDSLDVMVMWVGLQFPSDSVQKLFGVPSLAQVGMDAAYYGSMLYLRWIMLYLRWIMLCRFG